MRVNKLLFFVEPANCQLKPFTADLNIVEETPHKVLIYLNYIAKFQVYEKCPHKDHKIILVFKDDFSKKNIPNMWKKEFKNLGDYNDKIGNLSF